MPIYEFYCKNCHMIFNFFSASINVEKRPKCPRCKRIKLARQMSEFSTLKNRGGGEHPEQSEAEMGDLLEGEYLFSLKGTSSRPVKQRPPKVDDNLYYL